MPTVVVDADIPAVTQQLVKSGLTVEFLPSGNADDLGSALKNAHALFLTKEYNNVLVDEGVLAKAKDLSVIASATMDAKSVDVASATRRGVVVIASPLGFTTSIAEHALGLMLACARSFTRADTSMKEGNWHRKKFMGTELKGKTLGIIGFDGVAEHLTTIAKGFHMKVVVHDPYIVDGQAKSKGIVLKSVDDVLSEADYLSLHVGQNSEWDRFVNATAVAKMKKGVNIINVGAFNSFDESAVAEALKAGRINAIGCDDVPAGSVLVGMSSVTITPRLSRSTVEASVRVMLDTAGQVADVLAGRPARSAVNLTSMRADIIVPVQDHLTIAESLGAIAASCVTHQITHIAIEFSGHLASLDTSPLTTLIVKGVLSHHTRGEPTAINYVNCRLLAESRGIKIRVSGNTQSDFKSLITVKVVASDRTTGEVSGANIHGLGDRLLFFDRTPLTLQPSRDMIFVEWADEPGVLGMFSTFLGKCGINVKEVDLGKSSRGGKALGGFTLSRALTESEKARLLSIPTPLMSLRCVTLDSASIVKVSKL